MHIYMHLSIAYSQIHMHIAKATNMCVVQSGTYVWLTYVKVEYFLCNFETKIANKSVKCIEN